ncbi:MAG: hypothetical protein AAF604_16805 [Acidobacteriota bacterium]
MAARSCLLALLVLLVVGFIGSPVAAGRLLLDNGSFDSGVSGWTGIGGDPFSWSAFDAQGQVASGSVRIPSGGQNGIPTGVFQCVTLISPGDVFDLTAETWAPTGVAFGDDVYVAMNFFPDTACGQLGGNPLDSGVSLGFRGTPGQWHEQSLRATAPPGSRSLRVDLNVLQQNGVAFDGHFDNLQLQFSSCIESATAKCLNGGRFRVEASWRKPDDSTGQARVERLTDDTAYLWFFDPDNVEAVIKVNDACVAPFNRYWVFASGLTNLEVSLTVTDTLRDFTWFRVTTLDQPFPPILDTGAFPTCP